MNIGIRLIFFLKSIQLVQNNGKADKLTKEDAHNIIDVIHEITDYQAKSESERNLKEEIASILNFWLEYKISK